jgi:hypothetical protein
LGFNKIPGSIKKTMANSSWNDAVEKKIKAKISSIQFTKIKEYAKNHPLQFWQQILKNMD